MRRWLVVAALLLAMGAAMPSWAGVIEDCGNGETLIKTEPARVVAACYRLAADQGDAYAQFALGVLYNNGRGVPQDYAEALKWYRKAADQGFAAAEFNLGVLHDHGQGVAQDYAEAARWYRSAADQGLALAQFNLGDLYANG